MKVATSPPGITYKEVYKSSKQKWHVAVSASVAKDFPTLPVVLRAIACAPGSCCKFFVSDTELCKFFKEALRKTSRTRLLQRTCVLAGPADREAVDKKYRGLYISQRAFLLKFQAADGGVCPGWSDTASL